MLQYVLDRVCSSGNGRWCEDACVLGDDCVGVLDGATPIDLRPVERFPTQACWLTDRLSSLLSESRLPLRQRCAAATAKLRQALTVPMESYNLPCCTAALLSCEGRALHLLLIGDCHVYLQKRSGEIVHLCDDRTAAFSRRTLAAKGDEAAARQQRIENRAHLNRPGGFYAMALDDAYGEGFGEYRFQTAETDRILLCTDGFARLFCEYGLLTPAEFFREAPPLSDLLRRLRDYEGETASPACVKRADDAAAVLLGF